MIQAPEIKGDVAQMVERSLSMREVRGSIPRISTIFIFSDFSRFPFWAQNEEIHKPTYGPIKDLIYGLRPLICFNVTKI